MINSILGNSKYCKKDPKRKCYKFADGTRVCGCSGGWSVFFATLNKMGADETKPMPKKKTEESHKVIQWFMESTLQSSSVSANLTPKWVGLAEKVISSEKFSEKVKSYWSERLAEYKKKCKKGGKK